MARDIIARGMAANAAAGGGGGGGSDPATDPAVLSIGYDHITGALDKTWQEINDAPIAVINDETDGFLQRIFVVATIAGSGDNPYIVGGARPVSVGEDNISWESVGYLATSADGYPVAMG